MMFFKWWTFTRDFLKVVDFYACFFLQIGGLLCVDFAKWWTFTHQFMDFISDFFKVVDFYPRGF